MVCSDRHLLRPEFGLQVALSNLDLVIQESRSQFDQLLPHILEDMEVQWAAQFPRATAGLQPSGKMCVCHCSASAV